MKEENLKLWKAVEETNPLYTKLVTFGRKFTSINAQYQIMQATEQFGKYGESWGIDSIEYEFINLDKGQIISLVKSQFFYFSNDCKNTFPVSTSIFVQDWDKKNTTLRIDDEFAKKAETDITTKALSKLGFSADVFLGRYDDNRYVNSLKDKYKKEDSSQSKKLKNLEKFKDGNLIPFYSEVIKWANGNKINANGLKSYYSISDDVFKELENDLK